MTKIALIGAGNMARAMISGLIKQGTPAENIYVTNPSAEKRLALAEQFGILQSPNNIQAAEFADIIILAVKPHLICQVAAEIKQATNINGKLFISVAAGTTVNQISASLTEQTAIIRAMPNTPSQLGLGVTGLFANRYVSETQKQQTTQLMQAIGDVVWLNTEAEIDHIIAVSGSGPAYFFLFMEAMEAKAIDMGFTPEQARKLVQQTALGAAQMVVNNPDDSIAQLRANVTSKGGTTNAAICSFEQNGLQQLVTNAMNAALQRAKEMAENNA